MRFVLFFLLISFSCFSQNKETYFASRLQQGIYQYLDSAGIKYDNLFLCCFFDAESNLSFYVSKEQSNSQDLDLDLLNWFDDDIVEYYIYQFNNKASKDLIDVANRANIEVIIKQSGKRFSITKFKWKVKYKITVKYRYS